ncbi:hypothetical protein [Streptacidiphilus sp. PAMC 29251]
MTAVPADRSSSEEVPVPLPADAGLWSDGVALGRRVLWLHSFGTRYGDPSADRPAGRPRMPGGRRPFVRERVSGSPDLLAYDPETESVLLGHALTEGEADDDGDEGTAGGARGAGRDADGRLAPVAAAAWEYRAGANRCWPSGSPGARPTPTPSPDRWRRWA